jgi:hypothetical protein
MTSIESVWDRMKTQASDFAQKGAKPSERHAYALVTQMLREEHVIPWPPEGTIEFYAREMLVMIDNARGKRDGSLTA